MIWFTLAYPETFSRGSIALGAEHMDLNKVTRVAAWSLLAAAIAAHPVQAEEAGEAAGTAWDISANAGVTSDYRFRGISLSEKNPAIQGGVDVGHESGLFAGIWASSISRYGGSHAEVDLYAGYGGSSAGIDYSVTALAYVYPGGHGVDYVELMGNLGTAIGPATVGVDLGWVPKQDNFGGDNFYLAAKAEVPIGDTGVSLFGHFGRENGDVYDRKLDWEAGVSYSTGALTASLSYVDSNYSGAGEAGRLAKAGAIARLTASF